MRYIFISIIIFTFFSCENEEDKKVEKKNFLNHNISAKKLVDSLKIETSDLKILIDKSDYKLSILNKGEVLKEYPVVFGENPVDDKRMEGDKCTPEGKFKIRDLYPHKSWSKFIWFDYPTKNSHKKFKASKENGEIPKDATIGGEVGIHGVPKGRDNWILEKENWTWGCISLTNKNVNDLYSVCYKGMVIEIKK